MQCDHRQDPGCHTGTVYGVTQDLFMVSHRNCLSETPWELLGPLGSEKEMKAAWLMLQGLFTPVVPHSVHILPITLSGTELCDFDCNLDTSNFFHLSFGLALSS